MRSREGCLVLRVRGECETWALPSVGRNSGRRARQASLNVALPLTSRIGVYTNYIRIVRSLAPLHDLGRERAALSQTAMSA